MAFPTPVPVVPAADDPAPADETPAERRERLHKVPFGSRFLTDEADVFSHNAWDHVTPPPEWEDDAKRVLDMQRQAQVSKEMKWNTVFPLLAKNENPHLVVHACDYAASAVEVVKSTLPGFNQEVDVEGEEKESSLPEGVEPGTVDIAIMIFVLSALHPLEWQRAIANVYKMLKPGGMVFIRDYGRYDLAQLRIKKGRMLDENFYIRGDGTRVYFFDAAELSEMLTGSKTAYTPVEVEQQPTTTVEVENEDGSITMSHTPAEEDQQQIDATPTTAADNAHVDTGLEKKLAALTTDETTLPAPLSTRFRPPGSTVPEPRIEFHAHSTPTLKGETKTEEEAEGTSTSAEEAGASLLDPFAGDHAELGIPAHPLFKIDQLGVDRRMLVNRKKQLRMYRYVKLTRSSSCLAGL
ncbi:hypothetical protein QFC19_006691 [Naganishia cerealis]|uniref:Uncharacterized protein n=1 Tax=Naganishia cerealis TaxID=610337 RepID=A0ACC2VEQ0_9TREE|nr:hypothetical protein QFC19_006691 [Naganishia cerealis]